MPEVRLGEIISKLSFIPSERERILSCLKDESSNHFKVIKSAIKSPVITEAKFCVWAAKKLNFTGDRIGGDAQRQRILDRLIGFSNGNGQISEPIFWDIYCTCISRTIMEKMPELQKLLLEVKRESTTANTSNIFDAIFKARPTYKVPVSHIRDLYLLWGFVRDQSVEALFQQQPSNFDETQIDSIKASLNELKNEIGREADKQSSLLERERKNTESELEKVNEKIDSANRRNDGQVSEVKKQFTNVNKSLENIRSDLRSLPDKKYVKTIKDDVEKIENQLKNLKASIASLEKMQVQQNSELSRVNEKIGRKFLAATSSSKNLRKVDSGKNQMPEYEFIIHWQNRLSDTTFNNLGTDDLLAIHLFFKHFKCFIVQDADLFDTWAATLGWQRLSQMCVAEPTWYKSDQCIALQNFVNTEDSPHVLKIVNFNNALPEGYLFPLVLPWLQKDEFVDRKLILITSPGSNEGLKESAQYFPVLNSTNGKLDPSPILAKQHNLSTPANTPFFISTLSVWPTEMTPMFQDNREILNLLEAQNIELPPAILRTYTQVRAMLEIHYDQHSAILTAFQLIVQPWIQYCQSEIYAEQIMQNLRVVYG